MSGLGGLDCFQNHTGVFALRSPHLPKSEGEGMDNFHLGSTRAERKVEF